MHGIRLIFTARHQQPKISVIYLHEFPKPMNCRYRLLLNTIICSVWFYFSVRNVRKKQVVTFNITNFSKGKSLYRDGMTPLVKWTSRPTWQVFAVSAHVSILPGMLHFPASAAHRPSRSAHSQPSFFPIVSLFHKRSDSSVLSHTTLLNVPLTCTFHSRLSQATAAAAAHTGAQHVLLPLPAAPRRLRALLHLRVRRRGRDLPLRLQLPLHLH